jgi:hypothetical protein
MAMFKARTRALALAPSAIAVNPFYTSTVNNVATATSPREPSIIAAVTVGSMVVVTVETIALPLASHP